MKKIGFIIISIIILFSSCSTKIKEEKYTIEYGIVTSIIEEEKYDPTIHQYLPIYKLEVKLNDMILEMSSKYKPNIGDSIQFYNYE